MDPSCYTEFRVTHNRTTKVFYCALNCRLSNYHHYNIHHGKISHRPQTSNVEIRWKWNEMLDWMSLLYQAVKPGHALHETMNGRALEIMDEKAKWCPGTQTEIEWEERLAVQNAPPEPGEFVPLEWDEIYHHANKWSSRDHSGYGLHCNVVSHWQSPYREWSRSSTG